MNREEENYHQQWYKIFTDIEANCVGHIGFDPKSVPRYTPQNVSEFLKLYKYKKRWVFSPIVQRAIRTGYVTVIWSGALLTFGLFATPMTLEAYESEISKENKTLKVKVKSLKRDKAHFQKLSKDRLAALSSQASLLKSRYDKIQEQGERLDSLNRSLSGVIETINSETDEVCRSAKTLTIDSVASDNVIWATAYRKGIGYKCKMLFNQRVSKECIPIANKEIELNKSKSVASYYGVHSSYGARSCHRELKLHAVISIHETHCKVILDGFDHCTYIHEEFEDKK